VPSISEAIRNLFKEYGLEEAALANQAIYLWPEIVGHKVAKNCSASMVKGKTLFIKAKNSAWRNEIALQKEILISEINKRIGQEILEDISVK
jgi:predicted nucleic acid-binding Zn ribbon protein